MYMYFLKFLETCFKIDFSFVPLLMVHWFVEFSNYYSGLTNMLSGL